MTSTRVLLLRIASLGLHKVNHPIHCYPPLALKYIQSLLLRNNFAKVRLIDGRVEYKDPGKLLDQIYSYRPGIVVIFANFISSSFLLDFSQKIKNILGNAFIIVIGPVATWDKGNILCKGSSIDVIVSGEPEKEIVNLIKIKSLCRDSKEELLDRHEQGGTVNIVNDLDSLPNVELSKEDFSKYPFIYPVRMAKKVRCGYMETSRGCSYGCIFCNQYIRKSYSTRLRFKSPRRVVEEMKYLVNKGANFISLEDDNFTFSKEHVLGVCREIQKNELKIKWAAQARVDEVDEDILQEMRQANCELLQFGVESGSPRMLSFLKKTENPSGWISKCRDVFSLCRKIGISTCALFVMGSPTESESDLQQSIELAVSLNPDLIKTHFFSFYPGSKASEMFKQELKGSKTNSFVYHHNIQNINLSRISSDRLASLRKEFYRRVFIDRYFILNQIKKYIPYYIYNCANLSFLLSGTVSLFKAR